MALLLSLKIYLLAAVISMAVAAVIKLIGMVTAARSAPAGKDAPGGVDEAHRAEQDLPDEALVAAISAAIATVLGAHRIVHIEERSHGVAWSAEGRTAHHGSHVVPHHGNQAPTPKTRR